MKNKNRNRIPASSKKIANNASSKACEKRPMKYFLEEADSVFFGTLKEPLVFDDWESCFGFCMKTEDAQYNISGITCKNIFIIDNDKIGTICSDLLPDVCFVIVTDDISDLSNYFNEVPGKHKYILAEQADDGKYYIFG